MQTNIRHDTPQAATWNKKNQEATKTCYDAFFTYLNTRIWGNNFQIGRSPNLQSKACCVVLTLHWLRAASVTRSFMICAPCLNVDSQWCQFSSSLVFGIHSIYLFGAAKGLLKRRNQAGSEQVLWTSVKSCEVTRLPGWRQQKFWFAGWGHTRSHRGLLCLEKMWTTKASSFFRKKTLGCHTLLSHYIITIHFILYTSKVTQSFPWPTVPFLAQAGAHTAAPRSKHNISNPTRHRSSQCLQASKHFWSDPFEPEP